MDDIVLDTGQKKKFIESQVSSKVTKCNTDRIPHAALVITAVHLQSGQEQRNRESPEAEDGLMPSHHPHRAGKIKLLLKYYHLLETVNKTTEQR